MSFCNCCTAFFQTHEPRSHENYGHQTSIQSFVASADQGCYICQRAFENQLAEVRVLLRALAVSLEPAEDSIRGLVERVTPGSTARYITVVQYHRSGKTIKLTFFFNPCYLDMLFEHNFIDEGKRDRGCSSDYDNHQIFVLKLVRSDGECRLRN